VVWKGRKKRGRPCNSSCNVTPGEGEELKKRERQGSNFTGLVLGGFNLPFPSGKKEAMNSKYLLITMIYLSDLGVQEDEGARAIVKGKERGKM